MGSLKAPAAIASLLIASCASGAGGGNKGATPDSKFKDAKVSDEGFGPVVTAPLIPAKVVAWAPLPQADSLIQRIAFGSCSSQYKSQPIYQQVAETKPDLFVHLGDLIYADQLPYDGAVPEDFSVTEKARIDYALLSSEPHFRSFAESTPWMLTWDDHDFGLNDAGAEFEHAVEMEDLYLQFARVAEQDPRRVHPGVYYARTFGPAGKRVQVILLDTRSFRSRLLPDERTDEEKKALQIAGRYLPHTDSSMTLLGKTQWMWFADRLREPAELRLIGSSIQFVAGEKGVESWGNFPHEQRRLYSLIESTGAEGVLFLSGDTHFAELSLSKEGPYPLYDFTSSNLNLGAASWANKYKNSFRVGKAVEARNFGLVEIDWNAPSPEITLRAITDDGQEALSHSLSLDELRLPSHKKTSG